MFDNSIISSLVGSGLNMIDCAINRQYNRDNMLLQSSLNTGQYMLERALESPEQMVKQFEAAGLNPALMYGGAGNSLASGSSISGVSSTSQPSTNPFRLTAPSIVEVAQARNINADTKGKEIDLRTREDKNLIDLLNVKASIEEKLSKVKRNTAEAETLNKDLGLIQARIDNYTADTTLKGAQTATEGAKKSNIEAQTATEGTEQEKNKAQARKINAEANREEIKVSFEKYLRNVPMEVINSPSGTAWAIGILIPEIVRSGIKDIDSFIDTFISKLGRGTTKELLKKNKGKIINWFNNLPDKVNIPENSMQQLYDIFVF